MQVNLVCSNSLNCFCGIRAMSLGLCPPGEYLLQYDLADSHGRRAAANRTVLIRQTPTLEFQVRR